MGAVGAAVAGAAVAGGIGLVGSSMQSNAVSKGSREASLAQLVMLDRTRGDLQPYNAAGQNALSPAGMASGATGEDNALFNRNTVLGMSGVLGPEAEARAPVQNVAGQLSGIYGPEAAQTAMGDFQASPGYQFRLNEGMRAVDAQQAARGMLRSGATLKAEQEYAQGLASDEYNKYLTNAGTQYGNYYNRAGSAFGDYYSRLMGLATLGGNAAAQVGTQQGQAANSLSNIATGAAGAESRNIGSTFQGIQTTTNQLFNNKDVQDTVKSWLAPSVDVPGGTGTATWTESLLMSGSFGEHVSSFLSPNSLLDLQQLRQAPQIAEDAHQNALLQRQVHQQQMGGAEIEMLARGSQALLALGDEAKMAEQYPATVAELQRYGFAKNAPSVFPGKARLEQIAAMGTSSEKQYERQGNIAVGRALVGDTGATAAAPGAAPAVAPGGGATFAGGIAGFEGGGNAMPPENPRWPVARGGPAGAHQFIASTWNEFAKANPDLFKGMSPEQILAARSNLELSTQAANWYAGENAKALTAQNIEPTPANLGIAHALGAGGATKVLSAPDNTPLSQVIPETIAQNPQYGRMTVGDLKRQYSRLGPVGGAGAPGTGGGVAARTGGVDVAGPPGTVSGAAPAPAAGQFTPQQQQKLRVLAEAGRPTSEIIALQNQFRDENTAAVNTAYQREKDAAAAADRAATAARADADLELKRLDAAKGKSDADRIKQTLLTIGPKIKAGTASEPEIAQYAYDWNEYAYGDVKVIQIRWQWRYGHCAYSKRGASGFVPPPPGQAGALKPQIVSGTEKRADPAPAAPMTAMLDIGAGNRSIVKALDALEKYPAGVGLMRGSQPNIMSNWTDPEGVKVRAAIGIVQGHIYHDLAGTAQSAGESSRLRSFVPGAIDDAEAAKTKLRGMLESNRETLLDHYRAFGPEAGFLRQRGIEEEILSSIPQTAVDHLKENPKLAKEFDKQFGRGAAKVALQDG